MSQTYPYSVEFGGVGEPPAGREHVGHCSQVATFTRTGEEGVGLCQLQTSPHTVLLSLPAGGVHNGPQCGTPYRIVRQNDCGVSTARIV